MPYAHRYRGIPIWQHVGKEIRLPRYQGDLKSFRIIRQASEILEHVTVYLEVSFGWWIMYWWLKTIQLWWNVSVHSPMAYMTSLQKAIEDDISTEGNAATPGRSLRAQITANFREDAETEFITLSILQAVSNVINTARNVAGDIATRISNKILSQSPNIASKAVREIMLTVGEIILYAETTVAKFRDDTLTTAIHGVNRAFGNRTLSSLASDALLKYATDVFTAANDAAVVNAILQVIHRSLEAITQSFSRASLLWRAIFTNGANEDILGFILNHLYDLLQFLYDLVRPENVIPRFPAADDATEAALAGGIVDDRKYLVRVVSLFAFLSETVVTLGIGRKHHATRCIATQWFQG
ncbi:hypothetical protein IL306_001588 [Fusarium sp. DS 682]|nr:hypothetical protein IL306_001588 [Fusarium sp. DS 682]